jgi:hypothetical protein
MFAASSMTTTIIGGSRRLPMTTFGTQSILLYLLDDRSEQTIRA